ncbi:hypothetical protein EV421DRAFT_1721428 [Armillaria borealis]|uniref:Uncharacterized protein n=1 Tax=Armillaria borealis TaxID=47425 RepID=A0AA39IWN9_9AGAR|nr:hypothetical protein EV421DRAFT_1721428 [Armillaria borealis]
MYTTHTLLSHFFPSDLVPLFQMLQQHTSLLVSGSRALGFLLRTTFPGSDIDLYVNFKHFHLIVLFMITTGYGRGHLLGGNIHKPRPQGGAAIFLPSTTYNGKNICTVYEFLHLDNVELKVQVILMMETPMDIILGFHSTVPMNIVAHDVAVSLYPKATFNLGINCAKFDDCHAAITSRSKYTKHSWNLFLDSSAAADADLRDVERYIGDRHCWVIKLPKLHDRHDYLDVKHSVNGHSWVLTYPTPTMGFVTCYSSLFLPQLNYAVCASKTVMSLYQREMVSWCCHILLL